MSDDKDDKTIEPTPEPTAKKKKPEPKPGDNKASWSDHKQAELGDIPEKVEEWFKSTKLGQAYDEMYKDMKDKTKAGVADAAHSMGDALTAFKDKLGSLFTSQDKKPEDEDALSPMTSAEQASSPLPKTNLDKLDAVGEANKQAGAEQPEPVASSPEQPASGIDTKNL